MGTKSKYRCNKCDYSTKISGEPDMGFLIKTDTVLCENCKEIVDIITEYCIDEEDKSDIGKCPKCDSDKFIKKWDNEKRPCPKCSGKLEDSRELLEMWD